MAMSIVLRMCMKPAQGMEKMELKIASVKWDRKPNAKAAMGGHDGFSSVHRDYMALVHARGDIESVALLKMKLLLYDDRLWNALPPA
eukprot:6801057-Pyramimonas_sp.AAC.1